MFLQLPKKISLKIGIPIKPAKKTLVGFSRIHERFCIFTNNEQNRFHEFMNEKKPNPAFTNENLKPFYFEKFRKGSRIGLNIEKEETA